MMPRIVFTYNANGSTLDSYPRYIYPKTELLNITNMTLYDIILTELFLAGAEYFALFKKVYKRAFVTP